MSCNQRIVIYSDQATLWNLAIRCFLCWYPVLLALRKCNYRLLPSSKHMFGVVLHVFSLGPQWHHLRSCCYASHILGWTLQMVISSAYLNPCSHLGVSKSILHLSSCSLKGTGILTIFTGIDCDMSHYWQMLLIPVDHCFEPVHLPYPLCLLIHNRQFEVNHQQPQDPKYNYIHPLLTIIKHDWS